MNMVWFDGALFHGRKRDTQKVLQLQFYFLL